MKVLEVSGMKQRNAKEFYPLTYPQKSILLTEQFFNNPHLSTIAGYVLIKHDVNFELLEHALQQFIQNHDSLHLRFTNEEGEVKQYFAKQENVTIEKLSIANLEDLELLLKDYQFPLWDSQLFYAFLFETEKHEQGYGFCIHHSITDAWSEAIIISQVNQMYDCLLKKKSIADFPETSYLDMIHAEENYLFSNKFMQDKEYWEQLFQEEYELPEIRGTKNQFATTASRLTFPVPERYLAYCDEKKVSPFSFFLAAIMIYVSRIYQTEHVMIGTPVLNRSNFATKGIMGMFISTQIFQQKLDDHITVASFLANITSSQFALLRHQKYPLELIQSYYSEHFSRAHNLYDILFSYQNARVDDTPLSFAYDTKWIFTGHQADALDINIFALDQTGQLTISYDYLVSLYSEEQICDMHARLFHILDQMMDKPTQLVKDIEIVTPEEKNTLLYQFQAEKHPYDKHLTIAKLFEEQAKLHPDLVALSYDSQDMTYQELNEKANALALLLRKNGLGRNDIIGIMMYRSFEMIVAQLGILKAGAAYLPIDPAYPEERITYILSDSKCPLLLTTSQLKTDSYQIPTLLIDLSTLGQEKNMKSLNEPDDLAYVIYTSGSTGKPKGVMISQHSIVNTLLWRRECYHFDPSFTTLQIPSFSFDSSVEDIFTTLIAGGRLVLLKQNNTNFQVPQMKQLIETYHVNHFLVVPSFYHILLEELAPSLQEAKAFTVAGEGFSEELVKKHFALLPKVALYNEYGPTENSVCSTVYKFEPDKTKILIGKPITNCSCYVLNANLQLQPFDTKGELYLSGPGLSKGYIGREDLNASRFLPNPYSPGTFMYKTGDIVTIQKDGNLAFIERADFQVKYNGYRINLGEIESTIAKYTKNPNVVALLKKSGTQSVLAAYIETKQQLDTAYLKQELNQFLPHYMIPKEIILLEKFPTTPNGKINRQALEQISCKETEAVILPPRNDLDAKMVEIWKSVLNLPEVSIDTPIFDLGGDSLTIIAIQSLLFKANIPARVQDLFEYPTIQKLSDHIREQEVQTAKPEGIKAFPRIYRDDLSHFHPTKTDFPKAILLTGVTGFLGAHLLQEILTSHPETKVYVIIRERPNMPARKRLESTLDYYFDGNWKEEIGHRIIVVKGDLSRDMFGLNPTLYRELLVEIEAILNSASLVKHFGIYDLFYQSNVLSVQHLIAFAKESKCPIHHISTTSVSGNYLVKNDLVYNYTENDFYIGQNYQDNVYVHTKFEAEAKLFQAQQEGVTVSIYRMGNLMPRICDAKFQVNPFDNAYYKRMYGFIQLGILSENLKSQALEFTPVDVAAKAIITLLPYQNKVFHLLNTKTISLDFLIEVLQDLGHTIQFISPETFDKTIKKNTANEILESFITDLDYHKQLDYTTHITIDDSITQRYFALEKLAWPTITKDYLHAFLENMLKGGENK